MMGIYKSYSLTFLLLVSLFSGALMAQEVSVSEKELAIQAQFIEAQQYMIVGKHDKAEEILAGLARKHPTNPGIIYAYAQVLYKKEDLPAALREIQRARSLDPDNQWYAITEGDYLEKAGAYGEAANRYQALADRFPKSEEHHLRWAFYLIKDGRPEEAIDVYNRLEKAVGPTSDTSRKKYMLYRGMGRYRDAADVLENELARKPKNTEVMYMLAELYTEAGATDEGRKWYQRILDIHPGETEAQLALVGLTDPSNPNEDALSGLQRIFGDPNAHIDQKIKAIIPHIQEFANAPDSLLGNKLESLAAQLDKAHPNEPKVASILGDLAYYRGHLDEAIRFYQTATKGNQQVYGVWEQLLQACSEAHRYRLQEELALQALDLFPNHGRLHYFLAEAMIELHRYPEALASLQTGRLMARKDGFLLYHLAILEGRAHVALGQREKAIQAFDQAMQLNPKGPEVLSRQALGQKDPQEACGFAQKAAALAPQMPMVRFAQAHCALLRSDITSMKATLNALVQLPYPHPSWLEALGDSYALSGETDQALQWWQRVQEQGLGSPALEKKVSSRKYFE